MTWRNMQIEEEVRPWQITNSSTLYMFSTVLHFIFHFMRGYQGLQSCQILCILCQKFVWLIPAGSHFCSGFEPKNVQQNFISLYLMNFAHCQFIFLILLNYVLESPFLMQTSLVSGWILVRHGSCIIQLICPWTAHNRPCGSRSLPPLVTSSVLMGSKGFSNCTRMSTIQSRRPGNKAENYVTLTQKFLWKPCFTTLLPFLSSNPKIVKAFPKTLPTKMKPSKCPAREKKKAGKAKEEGKKESEKKKSRLLCHF